MRRFAIALPFLLLVAPSAADELTVYRCTDDDGRVSDWGGPPATEGVHRLVFDTGGYFGGQDVTTFYPEVVVVFDVVDADAHHHVPLLLSPFAYSTYRGS